MGSAALAVIWTESPEMATELIVMYPLASLVVKSSNPLPFLNAVMLGALN